MAKHLRFDYIAAISCNETRHAQHKSKKEADKQQLNINAVICSTLDDFRNKGAAWQSQIMADRLLIKLKELIPDDEWWKLKVAHSHYLTGEGAEELYDVCKELSEKYCT